MRRVPASASAETSTRESMVVLLKEAANDFVTSDPDVASSRRLLLAPVLVGEPSAQLLQLCDRLRETLHTAYGDASEMPAASWAQANFRLRLDAVGPMQRRQWSDDWLALPGASEVPEARAHLGMWWSDHLIESFKRANAAKAPPSVEAQEARSEEASDRQSMAVVGGWAVFSLRNAAGATNAASALRRLLPLMEALVEPGGAESLSLRDPAVLYLLARQQFGNLTALKPAALAAFDLASVASSLPRRF